MDYVTRGAVNVLAIPSGREEIVPNVQQGTTTQEEIPAQV